MALERAQHGVLGARQLGRDGRLECDLLAHASSEARARTSSLTRRPSARPAAFDITADITLPISFCDCAPVSLERVGDQRLELLVGDLLRQVAVDQLASTSSAAASSSRPALAVGLGGLGAALALALQDRDLALLVERRRAPPWPPC